MDWHAVIPGPTEVAPGEIILLEANPGSQRQAMLHSWLGQLDEGPARTFFLDCDWREDGPWTGLNTLFQAILPELQQVAPDLIQKHSYELAILLPAVRRSITVRNPTLTDLASADERVRNWAADRILRVVHGLIDLLDAWRSRTNTQRLAIACDRYAHAGTIVQLFFSHLMRRRGVQLQVRLLLAAEPGTAEALCAAFEPGNIAHRVRCELCADVPTALAPEEAAQLAHELEAQTLLDSIEAEIWAPRLIRLWEAAGDKQRMLLWQMQALSAHVTRGLYADAIRYGEAALTLAMQICPGDLPVRFALMVKLFNAYAGLDRAADGLQIVQEFLALNDQPGYAYIPQYYLAMLYARFLPEKDLALAEAYLEEALTSIERAGLRESDREFQRVFNRNGLALVRVRQGRPDEAIRLCREGYERLEQVLQVGQHRLHRSVLLYNTGQVYDMVGRYEEALSYYGMAIEMDPNYSEYYNDRGNLYLKLDRLEEAIQEYHMAIELSPPYPEVYTNLGKCLQLLGRMSEAAAAYSTALDLLPSMVPALMGRARAYEEMGDKTAALDDYTAALILEPDLVLALANRAILRYGDGDLEGALADLNRAIAADPESPELYQNRAVALIDMGRRAEAAHDLQVYLQRCPDAADRIEVELQLQALRAG